LGKPRILLVEDLDILAQVWIQELKGIAEVVWADNKREAENQYIENPDFELIVMNCCVPGCVPNTMDLVKMIRQTGFTEPIIARSGAPAYCDALIAVGATHQAVGNELIPLIISLLNAN